MNRTRMTLALGAVLLALILAGCNGQRRRVSREANSLTAAYVVKMDKAQTTADQDKRFIRAMSMVAFEMDRSIRGDKKAKQTRKSAEKLAEGGLDPDSDFDMDNTRAVPREAPKAEVVEAPGSKAEETIKDIEFLAADVAEKLEEKRKNDGD